MILLDPAHGGSDSGARIADGLSATEFLLDGFLLLLAFVFWLALKLAISLINELLIELRTLPIELIFLLL